MGGKQSKRLVPNRPPPDQPQLGPIPTRMAAAPRRRPKMVVPDGGWGWMVVLGACLSLFFFPGVTAAFGVLFTDRLHDMGATATSVALVANGLSTVWSLFALLLAPLTELFGYRAVTMAGGLLSFLTLLLAAYASSVYSFALIYSVMGGMSAALTGFSGIVLIPCYFDKRKGLANGLVASSSALGKIVMAPLVRYLLETYAYVWSCLLVGALSLHTCVAAMLYQRPELHMVPEPSDWLRVDTSTTTENGQVERRVVALPTTPEEDEDEEVIFAIPVTPSTPTTPLPAARVDDEVVLFSRAPERQGRPERRSSKPLLTKTDSLMSLASSCAMAPMSQKVYGDEGPGDSCWDECFLVKVFRLLNYSLLKEPPFHLVAWPAALAVVSSINLLYALPGYVSSLGYSDYSSAFAISAFGAVEVVFRLAVALLSDFSWFPTEGAYLAGFIMATLCTAALSAVTSYEWLLLWVALDGVALSLTSVLAIHIIVQYLGVDQYAQFISFQYVLNGLGFAVAGIVIGLVRDYTGSHRSTFLCVTVLLAIASAVWICRRCYSAVKYKKVPVQ